MEISQEKTDALNSIVKINLAKEDYEPKVTASLKKMAKEATLKGFRPGQAPIGMIKKMYGNSVIVEELNQILQEKVHTYIAENKLDIIGHPIPHESQKLDVDINDMKEIEFHFSLGHAPEIDMSYINNSPAFTKYVIDIDPAMVSDEMLRLQKRFATYEYPENVEENDILSLTIEELNDAGEIKEGGVSTVASLMFDMVKPAFHAPLMGMKKLDVINMNIWEAIDREKVEIAKHILNVTDTSKIEEIGNNFKLTLNNITRSKPSEINEEFFKKVYGEATDAPTTEAEMRSFIKKDLQSYFDGQTDSYLINEIYLGVMEHIDFPLPETFLKRWVKISNENPISDEQIEAEYPLFSKQLKWQLIVKNIVLSQNIQVTDAEVKERLRMQTIQKLYSYGMRNLEDSWIETFMEKQLQDKKAMNQTREMLIDDKALEYVKSKASLTDTPISFENFKLLAEAKKD